MGAILFFGGHFVFQNFVHTNFHAKSGLCSSRNERVMLNFVIWRPFCFSKFCQEMSELCSILWFGGHFVFQIFVKVCSDCPYKFGHQLLVLCTCLKKHIIWIYAPALSTSYLFIIPKFSTFWILPSTLSPPPQKTLLS